MAMMMEAAEAADAERKVFSFRKIPVKTELNDGALKKVVAKSGISLCHGICAITCSFFSPLTTDCRLLVIIRESWSMTHLVQLLLNS